jgi:hypothetical protein
MQKPNKSQPTEREVDAAATEARQSAAHRRVLGKGGTGVLSVDGKDLSRQTMLLGIHDEYLATGCLEGADRLRKKAPHAP